MTSGNSELKQFAEFYSSVHPLHSSTVKPRSPRTDESLQFDFIIGDFDIVDKTYNVFDGSLEGHYGLKHHSYYKDDQRMVVNELTYYNIDQPDVVIGYGSSLCTYSESLGKWVTTYLPSGNASAQVATGWWEDGEMHQTGGGQLPTGGTLTARAKFYDITKNSFKWKQEFTLDDGETWHLEQTHTAQRRTQPGAG